MRIRHKANVSIAITDLNAHLKMLPRRLPPFFGFLPCFLLLVFAKIFP